MGWVTLLWSVALLAAGIGIGAGFASGESSRTAATVWLLVVVVAMLMVAIGSAIAWRRRALSTKPKTQLSKTAPSSATPAKHQGSERDVHRGVSPERPPQPKAAAKPEAVHTAESAPNPQPALKAEQTQPAPDSEPPKREPVSIRTRTGTNTTGRALIDPYADSERPFTEEEDKLLLELQAAGGKIWSIANGMGIDQRQIAIRLIRLLIVPHGPINDESAALNNGAAYADGEKDQIEREYLDGVSVEEIAQRHGRTVLAIGWLLLERPGRPIQA